MQWSIRMELPLVLEPLTETPHITTVRPPSWNSIELRRDGFPAVGDQLNRFPAPASFTIELPIPAPCRVTALLIVTVADQVNVPAVSVMMSPSCALPSWIDWMLAVVLEASNDANSRFTTAIIQ